MYQIKKEIILDPFDKLYKIVFTINKIPDKIKNHIKTIHSTKLSPFSAELPKCKHVFLDPDDQRIFLITDKVSDLFNYLDDFKIETKLAKLLDPNSNIFCFINEK
tara:strand:- start:447 stop:761 length:315 start_codon:yes stop_codon:yes gene_type:complete